MLYSRGSGPQQQSGTRLPWLFVSLGLRCCVVLLGELVDKQKRTVEGIFVLHKRYTYERQEKVIWKQIVFSSLLILGLPVWMQFSVSSPIISELPEVSGGAEHQWCIFSIEKRVVLCSD